MCGVIAFKSDEAKVIYLKIIFELIRESSIRGLHGCGFSVLFGNKLCNYHFSHIDKMLAEIYEIWPLLEAEGKIRLIAHTRYSTSDLNFHQPIADNQMALAMNGIITQADFNNWDREFSYPLDSYKTRNDAEILFKDLKNGLYPFSMFTTIHRSVAAVVLNSSGDMYYFRNGKRPLWVAREPGQFSLVASTQDIITRVSRKLGMHPPLDAANVTPGVMKTLSDRWEKPTTAFNLQGKEDWQGVQFV